MKQAYKNYSVQHKEMQDSVLLYAKKQHYDLVSFLKGYEHCIRQIRAGKEILHTIKPKNLLKNKDNARN